MLKVFKEEESLSGLALRSPELAPVAVCQFTAHHASLSWLHLPVIAARMDIREKMWEVRLGEEKWKLPCVFVVSDRQQTAVSSGLGWEGRVPHRPGGPASHCISQIQSQVRELPCPIWRVCVHVCVCACACARACTCVQ